jgi:uracil-DNA glycosylase
MNTLNTAIIHPSWHPCFAQLAHLLPKDYLAYLENHSDWLPGAQNIFNAFSLDLNKIRFILFGESPYPRQTSANGYAFWDAQVKEIWSANGLSKPVNRATSLRNFIKMLLVAEGLLDSSHTSQQAITHINKKNLVHTLEQLFNKITQQGILLLNASLVFRENKVREDAKNWLPFMEHILKFVYQRQKKVKLLLFGKISEKITHLSIAKQFDALITEHPYNISFINNHQVISLFKPMHLLIKST